MMEELTTRDGYVPRSDVAACDFLKKLQQIKFFGTIYIFAEILQRRSELSKVF